MRNKAVYIALGIQPDGTKEVLGIWIEQTEGAKFWMRVMTELKNRGIADILIAVVDGLKGFPDAITAVFPKTVVQTCVVHLIRQSMSFASWKDRKEVARALRAVYRAADETAAWDALNGFEEGEWGRKYPPISQSWRRNWEHVIPFFASPEAVRRIIYTTDVIDKTFVPGPAIPFSCGRPRGEAWRVGWKRHRAAHSVPAGLKRPHTRPVSEGAVAMPQRSVRSFSLPVVRSAFPDAA
ncbi:MAG: IS256 family transposase, partial [Rhodobacteraceae bacterium]|nr:IS256 family transposase [Paracoccaceae bacterium]